jgi:cytochrome b561
LARWLHWLAAIGIFYLIYLGLEQSNMERGDAKSAVRALHGSVAAVVFLIMTVRVVWRFMNQTPAHPENTPGWQNAIATLVHWGLYITVFVQLVAGMMVVATGGKPVPFFGLFSVPLPVSEDRDAHHFWEEVHEFTWTIIAALLIVHVLAAIYNHFVLKNDVLRRMTSGLK